MVSYYYSCRLWFCLFGDVQACGRAKLLLSRMKNHAFHGLRLGGSLALPRPFPSDKNRQNIEIFNKCNCSTMLSDLFLSFLKQVGKNKVFDQIS